MNQFYAMALSALSFSVLSAQASPVDSLKEETSQVFKIIEANYGPLEYKKVREVLNWDQTKERYLREIDQLKNSRDYHFMMTRMFAELQDAHVSISLPSSYKAELPLQFSYVNGKTVLTWMSKKILNTCQPNVGDELISMDGESAEELRAKFSKYLTVGNARSNQSYLTFILSARSEERGLPLSSFQLKSSDIRLLDQRTGSPYLCTVEWQTSGVPLLGRDLDSLRGGEKWVPVSKNNLSETLQKAGISPQSLTARVEGLLNKQHALFNAHAQALQRPSLTQVEAGDLGMKQEIGRKEFAFKLPPGSQPVALPGVLKPLTMLVGSGLSAAIVPYQGKKIGVLRIPSYMATMLQFLPFELRYYIGTFEKEVDLLILDQTHNPGGAVVYSDWLIESLTGKLNPSDHMKFLVRPRHAFMRQYAEMSEMLQDESLVSPRIREKYEVRLKQNFNTVAQAYRNGDFLSEAVDLSVMSELMTDVLDETLFGRLQEIPGSQALIDWVRERGFGGIDLTKKQHFTKPVYMMIDELDFSGGDATPAQLQDYGRAKLIGLSTAGAGGTVEQFNNFLTESFGFHLTTSLMYRKDGVFVENIGVLPDIVIEPELSDLQNGFENYFEKIMSRID